ncbi:hypothetical protein EX30DRAFT_393234 [Ascodesmis nigricans]|uniref:MARVEL domain-containing protein n=1 Tax=Ascodesmis nigricans TaxID=341454 RepID=A0A4S2N3Y2_9PEZI|nr:hypothetical protein EX30DRAFT_393234 [Ascodesmis nigricans]
MSLLTVSHQVLRLIQLVFTTIILALAGALIEQQHSGGTPTRVNYSIYAAAFATLCLFYLFPSAFAPTLRHPLIQVILDLLISIFMLCAGLAMAAEMGGNSCSDRDFLLRNGITNGGGSSHMKRRCMEANALTAFEWFAFITFFITLLLGLDELRRDRDSRHLTRGRARATV